jgi:hypothetical protein
LKLFEFFVIRANIITENSDRIYQLNKIFTKFKNAYFAFYELST